MRDRRRPAAAPIGGRSLLRRTLSRRTGALLLAVALLAGCGKPAGVDGNLTDDWSPISAPTGFMPAAQTCHAAGYAETGTRSAYETVDCAQPHRTETVHVGTFTGAAASAPKPPAKGSAGHRAAYRDCDAKTATYVGGPWRTARLWIGVTQPSPAAWSGGARWYRCEALEVTTVEDDGDVEVRSESLRDELRSPGSPIKLSCYGVRLDDDGGIASMPAADCAKTHNAEFAGLWTSPGDKYPTGSSDWERFHDGCRGVIARYVGVPNDKNLEFRTGVVSLPGGEDVWRAGDRGVRCYLWLDGAKLTTSLKGKGPKSMPIQYE